MKTCMFTGMFRKRTFRETVENAAKIGYQGVEIRFAPPHMSAETTTSELVECRNIIEDNGIEAVGLYSFAGGFSTFSDIECEKQLTDVLRVIEAACTLGTPLIKINCGGPSAFLAETYHYEKSVFWLKKCGEAAAASDKKIVLEIHNSSLIEDSDCSMRLIEAIGCANVGLIHDAGNMYITGADYGEKSIKQLGKSLFHVHVKDVLRVADASLPDTFTNRTKRGDELFALTLLNKGGTDYQSVINALEKSGYTGFLSTEANLLMDDMEMAQHELFQLKNMIASASSNK